MDPSEELWIPAKTKLEAVNRLADLTDSGAQILGPGSKEHKSVLINLAIGLGIALDDGATKRGLARHLVGRLSL